MVRLRRALCVLLLAILIQPLAFAAAHQARSAQSRLVRVAFPIQKGWTYLDENGDYAGYTYEFLEEIAQYTGWEYEFVQVGGDLNESLSTALDMLEAGELDLLGGMLYSPELGEKYDYASNSYGQAQTVLQTLAEKAPTVSINSQIEQELKVAVLDQGTQRINELEDYCKMNLISPVYVRCQTEEEQVAALHDGRADVMLNVSVNPVTGVRTIASFAPRPFYFVTAKNSDKGLMKELNEAIFYIEQTDPNLISSLSEKYFALGTADLVLTEEEKTYIGKADTLRVAMLADQPPYQYVNQRTGEAVGITKDMLSLIEQKTGLRFELVFVTGIEAFADMAAEENIAMFAGFPYHYGLARKADVALTRPYASAPYMLLTKASTSIENKVGKRLALVESRIDSKRLIGDPVYFATTAECIQAVAQGTADYTYTDAYSAQYYLGLPEFGELRAIPQNIEPRKIAIGIVKPVNHTLLTILNKTILSLSAEERQGIVNQNLIIGQPVTLNDYVRRNPVTAIAVVSGVLAVIMLMVLMMMIQKSKAARKASLQLKRHQRVLELLTDHFFEYDLNTRKLMISSKAIDDDTRQSVQAYDFTSQADGGPMASFLNAVTSVPGPWTEARVLCPDEKMHWIRLIKETVSDGQGKPAYIIGRFQIIDKEHKEKERLVERAEHDSLTQVLNAQTVRRRTTKAINSLAPGQNGALLLVDVDHFKQINDVYGHMAGDQALVRLAEYLRGSFREDDVVGRPGGDEFMIFMRGVRERAALEERCDALCRAVEELNCEAPLSISVGASLVKTGDSYEDAYRKADRALYRAKELGRDCYWLAE